MAAPGDSTTQPKSIVIRMLGVFASLFGLPYLIQALELIRAFPSGSERLLFHLVLAIISLDLVMSMSTIVIGVGLFLHKEWARKAWLAYLLLSLFVQFNMTVILLLGRFSRMTALYNWIAVVFMVSVISWLFLLKPTIKVRFQ